jgi:hypothetical protein
LPVIEILLEEHVSLVLVADEQLVGAFGLGAARETTQDSWKGAAEGGRVAREDLLVTPELPVLGDRALDGLGDAKGIGQLGERVSGSRRG